MTRALFFSLIVFAGCGDEAADGSVCSGEEADINRVPTAIPPDWEAVLVYPESSALGRVQGAEPISGSIDYREYIQAWDCIQMSWWTPSTPRKVVQVWTDDTSCELYETSAIEIFDCDSHDGIDDPYRDLDGDGFYVSEGDCDDESAIKAPGLEERCDSIDNDCDGFADEYLDCSDIEAVDDGM